MKRQRQCPKVTIIGNTSWGNTLGGLLSSRGAEVRLWTRSEAEAEELNQDGVAIPLLVKSMKP